MLNLDRIAVVWYTSLLSCKTNPERVSLEGEKMRVVVLVVVLVVMLAGVCQAASGLIGPVQWDEYSMPDMVKVQGQNYMVPTRDLRWQEVRGDSFAICAAAVGMNGVRYTCCYKPIWKESRQDSVKLRTLVALSPIGKRELFKETTAEKQMDCVVSFRSAGSGSWVLVPESRDIPEDLGDQEVTDVKTADGKTIPGKFRIVSKVDWNEYLAKKHTAEVRHTILQMAFGALVGFVAGWGIWATRKRGRALKAA